MASPTSHSHTLMPASLIRVVVAEQLRGGNGGRVCLPTQNLRIGETVVLEASSVWLLGGNWGVTIVIGIAVCRSLLLLFSLLLLLSLPLLLFIFLLHRIVLLYTTYFTIARRCISWLALGPHHRVHLWRHYRQSWGIIYPPHVINLETIQCPMGR